MTYKRVNTAINQYLGHCLKCKRFEALSNIEGLCYQCRNKNFNKLSKVEKVLSKIVKGDTQ